MRAVFLDAVNEWVYLGLISKTRYGATHLDSPHLICRIRSSRPFFIV